jgi:hypothetical protein
MLEFVISPVFVLLLDVSVFIRSVTDRRLSVSALFTASSRRSTLLSEALPHADRIQRWILIPRPNIHLLRSHFYVIQMRTQSCRAFSFCAPDHGF